jgi:dihydropteroate synthase
VAERGLALGVRVLNDVTGFSDPAMLRLARASGCGLIAMRSRVRGEGFHMPPYDDPAPKGAEAALEELRALKERLLGAGLAPERLLLDPGFGFGTTFQEDLALWAALPGLSMALDWPRERFCLGISRKRFVAARAGVPGLAPIERDGLTAAAHAEAIGLGYRIFRTHALPGASGNLAG